MQESLESHFVCPVSGVLPIMELLVRITHTQETRHSDETFRYTLVPCYNEPENKDLCYS